MNHTLTPLYKLLSSSRFYVSDRNLSKTTGLSMSTINRLKFQHDLAISTHTIMLLARELRDITPEQFFTESIKGYES